MTIDQCARGPTDRDGEDDFGTDSVRASGRENSPHLYVPSPQKWAYEV